MGPPARLSDGGSELRQGALELAKTMGLGQRRKAAAKTTGPTDQDWAGAPKKRGRKKAA